MSDPRPVLYCHCAFARVVPPDVKAAVLRGLSEAGIEFDAVPDLCEMAARRDDRLRELAATAPLQIAACYPRAVRWLFASAGAALPASGVRVWNMRVESADTIVAGLLGGDAGPANDDERHSDPQGDTGPAPAGVPPQAEVQR